MQFSNIKWINNHPYSIDFDDIYFSTEDGLQETEYVFIAQNQLKQRFSSLHSKSFVVIETGFGTGLNFLAVADNWLKLAPADVQLHYISIEKYPLMSKDLERAQAHWPQFSQISSELISNYTSLTFGFNRYDLTQHRIRLDLYIGDIVNQLPMIDTIADAWLLDGFAPAKNAAMWSDEVFTQIARLSKGGTTFATFTSAGHVRRGLSKVGFVVNKQAGYGKKREMLSGIFTG